MTERDKPHLVRARQIHDDGTEEMKTVRADSLRVRAERQHEALSAEQQARAEALYDRIGHITHPHQSKAQWADAFLMERFPDREMAVYEHIADVADRLWDDPTAKRLTKRQLVFAVLHRSIGTVDLPSQCEGITDAIAKRIREEYDRTD